MINRELSSLSLETINAISLHQQHPPVKISQIAQALGGVKVISAVLPKGISGEIRPDPDTNGAFIIKVNKNDSARRQRFTVAHELAHYLLHKDQIGDGIEDDVLYRSNLSDTREAQANKLAAHLLMPEHLINEWINVAASLKVDDVLGFLADKFNVSQAAMKIRLGLK